MKRFLTFLALCCLMAAGAWAERYHIYQNNGTLHTTGSSTFCSQWTSTQTDPQISINVTDGNGAANDMQNNSTYADDGIVCFTGNDRDKQGYKATLTVAASHGYNITGYEFDASSLTDGCTISVSDGTTTKTLTGTTAQTISKTGVNAQNFVITIQCTAGSNRNTAVLFNNFYVTYEAAEPIENEYKVVFETPSSGTPYRIPAVAQAQNGDLIFVSDYRYSKADIGMATNGELDLKVRKKKANGTWEDEKTLQRCITTAPFTAFGDPCIVVDNTPGNPGKVMVTSCCGNVSYPHGSHSNHQGWARWYSTDNGDTWSSYTDISQQVVNQVDQRTGAKLAAFFIGSGKISQSKTIKVNNYNRLYCASLTTVSPDGADANKATMNYVWYSDDFGENWHMLGTPDGNPINGGNEPKAEELPDGSVLISSRTSGGRIYNIWHYTDTEAGKGYWGTQQKCTATYGADCNGEILVVPVTRASNSEKTYLLLQSIPADANRNYVSIYWKELTDLTKYRTAAELSNGGWTKFPVSTTTSAYSTMCQMKDGHIAFFYEEYDHNSGYDMVYKNFSVEEITNNAYSYSTLDATEKANYLTNGVGAYFDGESSAVQALAATYKAAPDADKYDALNAALQSPDELYFTPGWYRIKVGSGSAQKQAEYKGRYLYGKPLPDTWPIGVTDNANDLRTYVYITGTHDKWHIEFNHDTDAAYFATHDCKNSATPGNLSFIPNSEGTEWKIWGNNSYRWMGWYLNSTPSIGSTSTGNDTNNGCYFVFEKVDAPVLVAGKVYKIKAKFATGTSDIYLSAGSTGMTLPTAEATTPQSYWIARTTNDATYPWKFQSGYGNGKYLSVANGVSETASTFDVRTCADVSGTYHLWNSQSGGRYIGTYSSTNSKHGFGDFDGKGCWADGHHAGSDYTTDYIFEEVQNVTAYTVCGEGSLNVTGITGYTYASEISAGGVVIVPSNITPTATNFTTPDGLIAIVNTDAKTITLSKTYKKGVAVTQQSDLQDGDLVIVDVKAKNATTDAVLYYVGESTSMSNRNNFRAHINNVTEYPANHVWEVVDVNTSTTPNTFKLRSVADNTVYLPSGNTTSATNTAATFYFKESTGYNDGVNRFALAFSNNENADHYTYHFNAQPATGQGEPICFWGYGAASTDSQGAFAFYKVAEDIPTAEISLDNTTVTSSQLSELTITFTGDNAAQVQLSTENHTAYLTPKASTPAQVKAQNGKFKAAPAGAIEGNITKDTNTDGKFNIAFEGEIPAGDYELSIPEGTFYVGTEDHPVGVLTASYNVTDDINTPITYSHLSGATPVDPQWTAWEGEVSDGIKAINATKYTASNLWYIEKTYTFTEGQNLNVIFKWSGNSSVDGHRTDVIGVELLNADGSVAYSNYHAGSTGNSDSNNSYTINGIAAGTYKVRYIATTADGQCQTGGTISNVEVPVNGKVYTVYNDHSGNKWYVSSSRDANDCQTLTDTEASDNTQQWIAWGNTTSGYSFYSVASNATALKANDGIVFDIVLNHKKTGVTLGQHGNSARHQAGNKETKTLKNGLFTNGYKNEDSNWSTDFVFVPTGEYAYKVITTEGQTVTYNEKTYNKDAFVVSTDKLAANSVTASEISGKTASVSIDNDAMTITVTYTENTDQETPVSGKVYTVYNDHLGVPYYVSSSQNNAAGYQDLTKTADGTQQWIVWGSAGAGYTLYNLANNSVVMKANSGSVFDFTEDHKLTGVSIYKHGTKEKQGGNRTTLTLKGGLFTERDATKKLFNDEDYEWSTDFVFLPTGQLAYHVEGDAGGQVTVGGTTYSIGQFIITDSQLTSASLTAKTGYKVALTGNVIFVTDNNSVADPSIDQLKTAGTYYVYIQDKATHKYLYNDRANGTETLEGTTSSPGRNNAYIWRITSDGTDFDILNGQGYGYKASADEIEKRHGAIANIPTPWKITLIPESYIWDAKVLYCDAGEGYILHDSNRAYDGGFFASANNDKLGDDLTGGAVEGYKFGDVASDHTNLTTIIRYYTPVEEEDHPYLCQQFAEALDHMFNGDIGYFPIDYYDELLWVAYEEIIGIMLGINPSPDFYREVIEHFNYIAQARPSETVMPEYGDAFKLSVRSNNGRKHYYLKNDGTVTEDEDEAEIFVMGSTGVDGFATLFASNNNAANRYLQNNGPTAEGYEAGKTDINLRLMVTEDNIDNIQTEPCRRFGTFGFQVKKNAESDETTTATITLDETNKTWKITDAEEPLMKGTFTSAIELTKVEYPYNKPKFAVGNPDDHEGGYASIWLPYPMVFPDGVEAYRATSVENDGILILTKVNENHEAVAAGGYILYKPGQGEDTDPDDAANMPLVLPAPADPDDVTPCEDNVFVGSTENPLKVKEEGSWATFKENYEGTAYVLARKNGVIGYYKYKETESYLPKGKAIWFSNYEPSTSTECMQFSFGDIVEAIKALNGEATDAEIYDLQGHRLNKAVKGQVNVINGKKVMFK